MMSTTPRGSAVPPARLTMVSNVLTLALLAAAADASVASGQAAPVLWEGSRVRVTAPSMRLSQDVGTVLEATDETLVVEIESPRHRRTVPRSEITELDVSVRRESSALRGLGLGALIGAGTGTVIGLASGDDDGRDFVSFSAADKAMILGLALGVTGGVIGLAIGAANPRDVWSPVPSSGPGLAVLPLLGQDGAGVGVRVSLPLR